MLRLKKLRRQRDPTSTSATKFVAQRTSERHAGNRLSETFVSCFAGTGIQLDFFRGTFAPFFRASESPIAIACFLLLRRHLFPLGLIADSHSFFCASHFSPIGSQLFHTWPCHRSFEKQTFSEFTA
jgi:hypothetical protein